MTQYASKTPRELNHDPEPWVHHGNPGDNSTWRGSRKSARFLSTFDPRPEFDHVQHNEPNPILVAVRERVDLIDAYMGSVVSGDGTLPHLTINPRHYDHARRVLTRLANLSTSKED